MTQREKSFVYKAWEDKVVSDTSNIRNATYNAILNGNRKKGKKFIELWKKKQKRVDKDLVNDNLKLIKMIEKDKSWVDLIYKENGMKKPRRKKVE